MSWWSHDYSGGFFHLRNALAIRCPKCGKEASLKKVDDYLDMAQWINCPNCHFLELCQVTEVKGMVFQRPRRAVGKVTRIVRWPEEAYFQWEIRGHRLWAYNREHAQALLEFIGSSDRNERKFPKFMWNLRMLPAPIISAKARDLVVKRISETLLFTEKKSQS